MNYTESIQYFKKNKLKIVSSPYFRGKQWFIDNLKVNEVVFELRPPLGSTIIEKENNRGYIYLNDGSEILVEPLLESEYDELYNRFKKSVTNHYFIS